MQFLYSGQAVTRTAETVDNVMLYITGIGVVLLLGITAAMIYFVFKYNRKKGHKPVDIHGNIWLEIIWIGIPTILVMSMFYYSYIGFKELRDIPEDAFEVDVTARMWDWTFDYANGKSDDTLFVPLGESVKLNIRSRDVNHSLFIPAFRVKEDAVPGYTNYLVFDASKTGTYEIACAEYCGLKHSMMYTAVVIMPKEKFNDWYNKIEEPDTNNVADKKEGNEG